METTYTSYQGLDFLLDELGKKREDVNERASINSPFSQYVVVEDDDFEIIEETQDDELKILERTEVDDLELEHTPVIKIFDEKKARAEAKFFTNTNDKLHAFICGLISGQDSDEYEADDDELKDIQDAIFEWRKDSETHMPEWMQALAFIAVIYMPIYRRAFKDRKLAKQNKLLEIELEARNNELDELKEQIGIFLAKQKENTYDNNDNDNERNAAD